MKKPRTYTKKFVGRGGKGGFNDFGQPEKFFITAKTFLKELDEVPFSAIEDLKNYEINRGIILDLIIKCFTILDAANVSIPDEVNKMDADPFDGNEEDTEIRRSNEVKIDN